MFSCSPPKKFFFAISHYTQKKKNTGDKRVADGTMQRCVKKYSEFPRGNLLFLFPVLAQSLGVIFAVQRLKRDS